MMVGVFFVTAGMLSCWYVEITILLPINCINLTSLHLSRLVHCGKQPSLSAGSDIYVLCTRTGTKLGVESHTFRVESQRDQAIWGKALVNGSHHASQIIQQISCGKWKYILTTSFPYSVCSSCLIYEECCLFRGICNKLLFLWVT